MSHSPRRSPRASVPTLAASAHYEQLRGKRGATSATVDMPEFEASEDRRSESISPTPTVGTAPRPSPAPESVGSNAPKERIRRPMNSFLLFSNEHRRDAL